MARLDVGTAKPCARGGGAAGRGWLGLQNLSCVFHMGSGKMYPLGLMLERILSGNEACESWSSTRTLTDARLGEPRTGVDPDTSETRP